MFSEVRHAILPLALRRLSRRGDLERAGLLIESLGRHWRDPKPFELLIVAPNRDADLLRAELPRMPRINVTIRPESDFFPSLSRFYLMTGWYRQQIVKLQVPAQLGWGGYLTLDSDVVCVGDFDAKTFIQNGRALSRWEPKAHHPWWTQVAEVVGTTYDSTGHGLSVTPNILHGDLARQALAHFDTGRADAVTNLGFWILRKIGQIAWTEYSLYTSVAELKGNLLDYHVDWDNCYSSDVHLFSERSCVWGAEDFERMAALPHGNDPGGKFIIVQSFARIPIERVRQYCLSFAG
jgi:hypothetical protein